MYRISAVVLRRNDITPTQAVITLFSQEFGKFDCFCTISKSAPKFDIGSKISASIRTKKGKNTLVSVHTVSNVQTQAWEYERFDLFLWFFTMLYRLLPDGNTYPSFFQDLHDFFLEHNSEETDREYMLFLVIRFLVIFGIYQPYQDLDIDEVRHADFGALLPKLEKLCVVETKKFARSCWQSFYQSA